MTNVKPLLFVCLSAIAFSSCSSPPPLIHWEHTGGPVAQNVSAIVIDEQTPSTLHAGLVTGEIFFSENGGSDWKPLSTVQPRTHIYQLLQHPERPAEYYAATDAGLYRSTNSCREWVLLPLASLDVVRSCQAIAIDPFDSRMMYAGVRGQGIYRSTDAGETWTPGALGLTPKEIQDANVNDIRVCSDAPDHLYAALSNVGMIRSTNSGESWEQQTRELAASGTIPTAVVVKTQDAVCFGTAAGDVYKSVNGGRTWSPTRQGTVSSPISSFFSRSASPDILFAGSESGVLVSSDFGSSWRALPGDLPRVPCTLAGLERKAGTIYAMGAGIGVQRSRDEGLSWQPADRGLGGSAVRLIASDARDGTLYCTTGGAVFRYSPSSSSWVSASDGLQVGTITSLAFDVDSAAIMYAGTSAGIYKTTNRGTLWTEMPRTFGPHAVYFFDTHRTIRTRLFAETETGLFVSTDRGAKWNLAKPPGTTYGIRSMLFHPRNSGIIHAATHTRAIVGSTDGGLTWESNKYGINSSSVHAITHDPENEKVLYCWTEKGAGFRSTNRGIEWDQYASPWDAGVSVFFSVDREDPGTVVALVDRKQVFYSANGGATWKSILVDALREEVLGIYWKKVESALYVGTDGRGVYRLRPGPLFSNDGQ